MELQSPIKLGLLASQLLITQVSFTSVHTLRNKDTHSHKRGALSGDSTVVLGETRQSRVTGLCLSLRT